MILSLDDYVVFEKINIWEFGCYWNIEALSSYLEENFQLNCVFYNIYWFVAKYENGSIKTTLV